MEYALEDIFNVGILLDSVIKNGPFYVMEEPVTPENIAYTSCLLILTLLGTFGNILILIMFSKKELSRTSYSIYIRAAAVSDTIFMLMNISEDVIDHLTSYNTDEFYGTSYAFCMFWTVTKGTFRTASPWIVVALALDRCVAIWNPLHRTRYCTKKAATIITASIGLVSLGVEIGMNSTFMTMRVIATHMICDVTGMSVEQLAIKNLLSETGLPCITILIPNLLVIYKIQQSLSFRRAFSATNDQQGKVAKSARPLLVVSCLAFITLLPISITEMVELAKMNNADMVNDDYPVYADGNSSFNRTFDDHVFNFSNKTFENITTMRPFDEKDEAVRTNPIESTSLGTDYATNANADLIDSTSLGTDHKRNGNKDLIESTSLRTGNERNANPDLIESTGNESEHDEMNTDDLENQENGENQTLETENLGNDYDDEESEDKLLDLIWKICNFIHMCNFAQNFYLLILSSSTYRNATIMMFSCKCRKKKRATREIQQPADQTISHPSRTETASTSLEAVNLNVQ